MIEELFPYQLEGADWLSKRRVALLADEMGLGKSGQTVRAADTVGAKNILIICPAVARVNWQREFDRWSLFSPRFFIPQSLKETPPANTPVICSYDYVASSSHKLQGPWDLVVVDECHFIKSLDAKRTKAILGREGIIRKTKYFWALSGTPAPNHPGELWPLLYTFGATKDPYQKFIDQFCVGYHSPQGFRITGARTSQTPVLRSVLQTIMLRRKKEDVMKDLPPLTFDDVVVEAGPVDIEIEQSFAPYTYPVDRRAELAEKLKAEQETIESIMKTGGGPGRKASMAALEALAQSVSTLRRYTGLQKVQGVADLVTQELEAKAYKKIVIFAIHRDVIEGLRVRLLKFGAVTVYGGTDPDRRQRHIDKFQNSPKTQVFIGNITAAGTAITLTAAHHVLFAEQDWVPGNNAQATMRCHRIGQKNPVFVRFVGLANSFDERIASVVRRKTRELIALFDGEFELQ